MRCNPTFLFVLLFLAGPSGDAMADIWKPQVSVGSDFPVSASVQASVKTPFRLQLGAGLGKLPDAYAEVINDVAVSMGGYDEETADIIRRSLRSSVVFSGSAGVDTWSRLRLHADYTVVTLGGATTTPEVVASVAGVPLPFGEPSRNVEISSSLRMMGFGLSWPFHLGHSMDLRVGLGARFTVSADTRVQSSGNSSQERSYERAAERELNEIYTTYAHTPVASLHFEYGF